MVFNRFLSSADLAINLKTKIPRVKQAVYIAVSVAG